MDFAQLEEADGVRMTWNVWPTSKVDVGWLFRDLAASLFH